MFRNYLMAIAAFFLAINTGHAEISADRGENMGVGSGIVVGAIAAGPLGAILGATTGGLLGNQITKARLADQLEGELSMAEAEAADLRLALETTRADLSESEYRLAELQRRPTPSAGLEMEVLFRTGSSDLDIDTEQRLVSLAEMLDREPDLVVTLDGHADRRGDEQYNLELSDARAESVRQILISHGLPGERIASHAHGDAMSIAGEGDLDAYALERNVRIRLDRTIDDTHIAKRD
ncbi:MAG: OmpA family protein [Gammaproteobacteria bacterium]